MRVAIIILFLLGICSCLSAQSERKLEYEAQKNLIIEQSIEIIAEGTEEEEVDYTTLFDILSTYYENPISLNNNKLEEDLNQLGLLSSAQINNILEHREKNGNFISIYELQAVPGFDLVTIRTLMPFITVKSDFYSPHTSIKEIFKNANNQVFLRYSRTLEQQEGFEDISDEDWLASQNSRYLGSADRVYLRYRFQYLNNLSIGFTAEKDQGETFFGNSRAEQLFNTNVPKGFDFYSAHFYIRNIGPVKALAIGDYQAQFGQGLTFWSGLAFGKSANILTVKRNPRGLRPYSSVDENRFLRGAAVTLNVLKHFEFTAFGSSKKIDANITAAIDSTDNLDNITVSSFQQSGFHNTISQLEDKDAMQETIGGGRFEYTSRTLNVAVTGSHVLYDGNLNRSLQPYSRFQFNNNQNTVIGADYSWIYKNFNFFGEASRSANGGKAILTGFMASLTPNFALTALYRNYGKDYQNLLSMAFAESSTNVNEKGIFIGLDTKFNKNWTLSAYMDQFSFPWLRFQTDKPNTSGYDALLQLRYKPSRDLDIYARYRHRLRPINTDFEVDDIETVGIRDQSVYRINLIYKVTKAIRLQSRIEYNTYKRDGSEMETGFLIFQDVNFKPMSSPFSFSFRYAIFDTDGYNARLYAYENDVLYYFAIPAYSNRGTRMYLTTRYKIARGVDIWLRYSQWYYNNVESIGSGLNEIEGNKKSEIRALLVLKF